MRVEDPYGNINEVPFYTDIFSPHVDFISQFRFTEGIESPPIPGLPYTFTLLDALGNPIDGAVSTDTWNRCNQTAPVNLEADIVQGDHVDLSWNTVEEIPDEFDPGNYQITVYPFQDEGNEYGSDGITGTGELRTWHRIPWNILEGGSEGWPDGSDFGQGFGEFDDGMYTVQVWSWNNADESEGGHGSDCAVHDSSEGLLMSVQEGQVSFNRTGSISGVVTTEGGDPIEGAWVDACDYAQDQYCVSAVTDNSGAYHVTVLPAGGYRVRASGDEWAAEFYDDTMHHHEADEVLVSEGDETGGIDFALARGGSISGTVYDAAGDPLAGIAVDTEFGGFGTCTDESGEYTLQGVPLGTYSVVAGRQDCEPHAYIEELIPDITIDEGTPNIGGVDFYLQVGGSISGAVADETGAPLEGIWVDICEYDPEEPMCWGVETDAAGNYAISGLPAGDYRVGVTNQPGWASEYYNDVIFHEDAMRVPVLAGTETPGIDFVLAKGGSISGTVFNSIGDPLGGIAVDTESGGYGTCTDGSGYYELNGLPLGTYNVVAGREFCDPHPYLEALGGPITLVDVAPDVGGVDFYLQEVGSISGRLTDETGAPLEGIWVNICEYDPDEPMCWGEETDAAGNYAIGGLPAGDYRVGVTNQPGWAGEFYDDVIFHEEATRVPVLAGLETPGIDFVLMPGGSISGTVYDAVGNPLGGIAVDTESGGYGTCTDENGYYKLNGMPLGTYTVVAGRDFCDPHPYQEALHGPLTLVDVAPDVVGIDFSLEEYVEPSPQFLNLQPDHLWAHSGGWTPGADVTISFDGYSETLPADGSGFVEFNLEGSGIAPEVDVHITDGVDFKDLYVVLASFDGADDTENTAEGTGPAGMWIGVEIVDEDEIHYWVGNVQIDGGGNWIIDFDDHGHDFGVVTGAWVHIFDDDGDSTLAHLDIAPPG
jgi:hypothetical protein